MAWGKYLNWSPTTLIQSRCKRIITSLVFILFLTKQLDRKWTPKGQLLQIIVFPSNSVDSIFQCVEISQCYQRGLKYKAFSSYLHNIIMQRALTSVIRVSQGRLTGGLVALSYLKPPCLLSSLLKIQFIRDLQIRGRVRSCFTSVF